MLYRLWLLVSVLCSLWIYSARVEAFAIPQPEQDIAASKLAHIQFNAANGEPAAQYLLALMQLSGKYTHQDLQQGTQWLIKAAAQGHIKSQQTLADLSFEGKVIPQDLMVAEHWYTKLAAMGETWAKFRLGFIYAAGGQGIARHCGKALDYFYQVGDDVALSNAAWILATCPEAEYRDGRQALGLALRMLENNAGDPVCLDNLAAAYAELGQFDEAITTQKQAIIALSQHGGEKKLPDFESRLTSYSNHQAYREQAPLTQQN